MSVYQGRLLSLIVFCFLIYFACFYNGNYQPNHVTAKTDYHDIYHHYDNQVDIRVIIFAYNRPESLHKCLNSFQGVITDDLRVSLEVWIDLDKNTEEVDHETLRIARDFRWTNGPINIWIHGRHVGLIGQWLYTWRPRLLDGVVNMDELALLVEDDVDVSSYGLRWLYAVHNHLKDRDDVACYALQDENVIQLTGSTKHEGSEIPKPTDCPMYLYRLPGSWAMGPQPQKWLEFQDWYEETKTDSRFHPYVKNAPLFTKWYKQFEKLQRQDTMWTIWLIYFMDRHDLFCAYSNLPAFTGLKDVSLSSNRREAGLHYSSVESQSYFAPILLTAWDERFVQFSDDPDMYIGSSKKVNGIVAPRYIDNNNNNKQKHSQVKS